MALIAHYKTNEGVFQSPTTAVDSAAGGSGSHNGTYEFVTSFSKYVGLIPGAGIDGRSMALERSRIYSISNPSDFRSAGEFTLMWWFCPDTWTGIVSTSTGTIRYIMNCTGTNDVDAVQNDLWNVYVQGNRRILVSWETAPGTRVTVNSPSELYSLQGWNHMAVARYEVVAGKWGIRYFINGQHISDEDNSGAGYDPPNDGGSTVPIVGAEADGSWPAEAGFLSSVRFYNSVETESSVSTVYNSELHYFGGMTIEETGCNRSDYENAGFISV